MADITQHPLYRSILAEDIGCSEGLLPTDIHEGLEALVAERDRLHAALSALLDYEDDRPAPGTFGASVYAEAEAALADALDEVTFEDALSEARDAIERAKGA